MSDGAMISQGAVRGAYGRAQTLSVGPGAARAPEAADAPGAPDFGHMVRQSAEGAAASMRASEATAMAGLKGEASTQEVVEAMLALDATVKVAVSVRDRLVAAYQEILRMPI